MIHIPSGRRRALPPSEVGLLAGASLLALLLRVALLLGTWDAPGDGPRRAIEAYQWSRHPWLPTSGVWPPGLLLLTGPANWILPRPDVATRLLNVALGTLTIPALYLLARRGFGTASAVVGAFALAAWPLHIELSASSLAEAPFLFELLGGLLLVDVALDGPRRRWALVPGLALVVWASMARYEGWWFLPILPLYILWRSRSRSDAAAAGAVLAAFPLSWLVGNAAALGDPIAGLTAAVHGAAVDGADAIGPLEAVGRLATVGAGEIGWPLIAMIPVATAVAILRGRESCPAGALLLAISLTFWVGMLCVTCFRDHSLHSRYLLPGLVLALPMLVLPFRGRAIASSPWVLLGLVLATLASFASTGRYETRRWVTAERPTHMEEVARWISSGPCRDSFVVLTDMDWKASYLAIFWPEVADRRGIVSEWIEDDVVAFLLLERAPALLVTRDADVDQRARIERVLGTRLDAAPLAYQSGPTKVLDLSQLVPR